MALYVYAKERAEFDLAFSVALVLLAITLAINLSAKLVGKRLKSAKEDNYGSICHSLGLRAEPVLR